MENKQSSIDWLVEQLIPNAMRMFDSTTCNAIEQAKAMHKQEIVDAYEDGHLMGSSNLENTGKQHYHETYGNV